MRTLREALQTITHDVGMAFLRALPESLHQQHGAVSAQGATSAFVAFQGFSAADVGAHGGLLIALEASDAGLQLCVTLAYSEVGVRQITETLTLAVDAEVEPFVASLVRLVAGESAGYPGACLVDDLQPAKPRCPFVELEGAALPLDCQANIDRAEDIMRRARIAEAPVRDGVPGGRNVATQWVLRVDTASFPVARLEIAK